MKTGRLACLVLLILLCLTGAAPMEGASSVPEVSLIQVIANPQAFDGQRIRIVGFVNMTLEDEAVFLHREDWEHFVIANAIKLGVSVKAQERLGARVQQFVERPGYAEVEGVFRAGPPSARLPYAGTLVELTRLEPWAFENVRQQRRGCW